MSSHHNRMGLDPPYYSGRGPPVCILISRSLDPERSEGVLAPTMITNRVSVKWCFITSKYNVSKCNYGTVLKDVKITPMRRNLQVGERSEPYWTEVLPRSG